MMSEKDNELLNRFIQKSMKPTIEAWVMFVDSIDGTLKLLNDEKIIKELSNNLKLQLISNLLLNFEDVEFDSAVDVALKKLEELKEHLVRTDMSLCKNDGETEVTRHNLGVYNE